MVPLIKLYECLIATIDAFLRIFDIFFCENPKLLRALAEQSVITPLAVTTNVSIVTLAPVVLELNSRYATL